MLMSNTVSPRSRTTPEAFSISISMAALTYSSRDWSSVSSCDHSTLNPTVCTSMHGRGIVRSSLI